MEIAPFWCGAAISGYACAAFGGLRYIRHMKAAMNGVKFKCGGRLGRRRAAARYFRLMMLTTQSNPEQQI